MSTPQKIPLQDIKSITDDFSENKIIGGNAFGNNYEGQLSLQSGESIDVAVRRLDCSYHLQVAAFDKEIAILSKLEHQNMVSMVRFCYENNEMIIVNKLEALGSLNRHLSNPKLTWIRRLNISVGVASALIYLHSKSVVHHNVNTTSILLDEKCEAKLSGFEYSMISPAERNNLIIAYKQPGIGSYKADVFSFGIVLFEILCGDKEFIAEDGSFQAPQAIFRQENRKLHELVDRDLYRQMDPQSFNIFSETACYCLREQRPSMSHVLNRLEKALELQRRRENPEHTAVTVERELSPDLKLMLENLGHMRVQLKHILEATENFASERSIASGGFCTVYRAELDLVDREHCFAKEGESVKELPKRSSEVAIKRIYITGDASVEGFYAEIEMLTKCRHSNILTLLGFCDEGSDMILIYEYAPNRSLADYLQKKTNIHNDIWLQRIKICLDAAKGLSCLHTSEGDRQEIVHRDIKSDNILLGKNFEAMIGDFGLSKFLSANEEHSGVAGTRVYIDPQYLHDAKLKKQIDVYSFGIVLFEALCGTLAYDPIYSDNKGLAFIAQQNVSNGTVTKIIDPKIKDRTTKTRFTSIKGPDQDSVDVFSKIAYRCLDGRQENRPTMEVVIEELEKAILLQENRKEIFLVPLELIKSATHDFKYEDYSVEGEFWKVCEGEILHDGKCTRISAKRLDTSHHESEVSFLRELKILLKYKHESLVGLVGYCDEMNERIILYDTLYDLRSTLDWYVFIPKHTWMEFIEACLNIASGLELLHGGRGNVTEEIVIHGNIRSSTILSDARLDVKIACFEHSVILPINQETVLSVKSKADSYTEPEYARTGLLSKECDIYSFGVVLCDIMFRRPAWNFWDNNHLGRLTKKGTLDELLSWWGTHVSVSQSLTILHRIAVQCLQDNRQERPTAGEVVTQLREALQIHVNAARFKRHNQFNFSLDEIKSATDKFSDERFIGGGRSGKVYTGQLPHANGPKIIAAKRFATGLGQENDIFDREFHILAMLKHENIIKIEGYCEELDEKILVYEYASKGSLNQWLNKDDLTWMKRLAICIDIASGLEFIHEGFSNNEYVIHKCIKSSNILLSDDWRAKISDFEFHEIHKDSKTTNRRAKQYDIYPFGVVLLEILCGRLVYSDDDDLRLIAKRCFEEGKLDEMVFEVIKGTVGPKSYDTFSKIAHRCLDPDSDKRPPASKVLVQLKKALEYQEDYEDYEMWEHKLPTDYERLIQMSKNVKITSNIKKKDLYDMLFSEGILLRVGKVSISFDQNKRRKELISARMFYYKNPTFLKWKIIPKSRFHKVSMMSDVSNLMIQVKIKTQFLSPNVNYGVHLIFKFGDRKKVPSKLMYVNLKYTMRNETMHAYFAEQRDDTWMQIELFRFFNLNEETDFEVLLESFSKYYCGSGVVYIEGIEFRAIDNVKLEEMDKLRESQPVLRLSSNMDQVERLSIKEIFNDENLLSSEVDGKKHFMYSALLLPKYTEDDDNDDDDDDDDVYIYADCPKVKLLKRKPSEQSRFPVVIELLPQQVFRIRVKIEIEMLSPYTDYMCFIVFKLSDKCRGLHCPVKVRNQLRPNNKEIGTLYFRTPTPLNVHDMKQVSRQREDEWMEVSLWKFNSTVDLIDGHITIDLKLICYEGTMAGLILYGLEFRPM